MERVALCAASVESLLDDESVRFIRCRPMTESFGSGSGRVNKGESGRLKSSSAAVGSFRGAMTGCDDISDHDSDFDADFDADFDSDFDTDFDWKTGKDFKLFELSSEVSVSLSKFSVNVNSELGGKFEA